MESLMRIYKEDIENIEMDIELYERIKNENERQMNQTKKMNNLQMSRK